MKKVWCLFFFCLMCSFSAWAKNSKSAAPSSGYKGEAPASAPSKPISVYKDDSDIATVAPESKYSGQVYNSDFYQGALQTEYTPVTDRSLHDGVYVGVAGGYDSYKIRDTIDINSAGVTLFQQNPDLNAVGMSYEGMIGVGKYFDDPLYMGAEFFYNYSRANSTNNVGDGGIDYYVKSIVLTTYGLSILPGIKLSDNTMMYLRGGYTRIDMKTFETSTALSINNAQSNGVNGFHFGLGVEAVIYRQWSLRGEYTHTNGKNFKTQTGTVVTPTNNQVMLGLLFHLI